MHSFSFLRLKDVIIPNCFGRGWTRRVPTAPVIQAPGSVQYWYAKEFWRWRQRQVKEERREGRKDGQNGRREDNPGMSSLYLFLSPVFCVGCPIWIRSDGSGRAPRMLRVWNAIELISHLCFATDKHSKSQTSITQSNMSRDMGGSFI